MEIGINTVTFRPFTPEQVVEYAGYEGISLIEWAGTGHAPAADLDAVKAVRRLCEAHGVSVASYGSYYRCDDSPPNAKGPFAFDTGAEDALAATLAIGSKSVRIWAGGQGSEAAPADYRTLVTKRMRAFCEKAAAHGISVHLEFHRNTLTDAARSTINLISDVGCDNLFSYWQPRHGISVEESIKDIEILSDRLTHVHVFNWTLAADRKTVRLPLADGEERWMPWLRAVKKTPHNHIAFMEFVKGDTVEQYHEDAAALKRWLSAL